MVDTLKKIGNWFIGKSEEVEKLDEEIKVVVNQQTKRAFLLGFGVGIVVSIVVFVASH